MQLTYYPLGMVFFPRECWCSLDLLLLARCDATKLQKTDGKEKVLFP